MKLLEFAKNLCNSRKQYSFHKQWNNIPFDPNEEANLAFRVKVNLKSKTLQQDLQGLFQLIDFRCRMEMTIEGEVATYNLLVSTRAEYVEQISYYASNSTEVTVLSEIGKGVKRTDAEGKNLIVLTDIFTVTEPTHDAACEFCAARLNNCCNPDFLYLNYRPYCDKNDNHPPFPFSNYFHHQQQQPAFLPPPPPPPPFQLGDGYNYNNYVGGQQIQQPLLLPAPPPPPQSAGQGEPYYYRNQEEYSACSIM